MKLFNELKRRNVFKVGAAYLVLAWFVIQIADAAVPALRLPEWVNSLVFLLGMLGLPFALFFAWAFEMTPEGIKRESEVDRDESITATTGKKLEYSIIGLLVIALAYFIWSGQTAQKPEAPTQQLSAQKTDKPQTTTPNTAPQKIETAQTEALLDKSIAVLPFSNRSNNQEDVFFVDGMHDDLLTKLAKSHELRVISRTSVLEYRNTTKKIPQIAQELGVNHILEGGVQRSGNHIRVNAQLINAATDEHLWAETYDKELTIDNVFAIQTEITVAIAKALEAVLSPEEKKQINKPLTNNLLAWQAYRQGWELYSSEGRSNKLAIKSFKKAIELDQKFAVAYASMATVYMNAYWFGVANIPQPKQKAWQAIEASRALDNNTAELFIAEAAYYYWGFRDFSKALAAIENAIAIAPNNAQARSIHGFLLRRTGRFDESIKSLDLAANLNPRSVLDYQENAETLVNLLRYKDAESYIEKVEKTASDGHHIANIKANLALNRDGDLDAALQQYAINKETYSGSAVGYWWTLLAKGTLDEAIIFAQSTKLFISTGPYYSSAEQMTGLSYFIKGDLSQTKKYLQISIEQLNALLANDPENKNYLVSLCRAHAALKNTEKAEGYCKKALTKTADLYDYPLDLISIVEAYAMLGAKEQALSLLRKALEYEVRYSAHYLRLDPFLKNLHDDPRFEPLIQRIDSGELVKTP